MLPERFRLEGSLQHRANGLQPFHRDLLLSMRLQYLHVLFLSRLVVLETLSLPDVKIFDIAKDMLACVVEAMLSRDDLVNSGTGLIWKVSHYGLPAAGIILLFLLNDQKNTAVRPSYHQELQNLSVLAAEVQKGSLVKSSEPSSSLLLKATATIQAFLDQRYASAPAGEHIESTAVAAESLLDSDPWSLDITSEPWNLDWGMWDSLAEHPLIMTDAAI